MRKHWSNCTQFLMKAGDVVYMPSGTLHSERPSILHKSRRFVLRPTDSLPADRQIAGLFSVAWSSPASNSLHVTIGLARWSSTWAHLIPFVAQLEPKLAVP